MNISRHSTLLNVCMILPAFASASLVAVADDSSRNASLPAALHADAQERDPFWPIGYKSPTKEADGAEKHAATDNQWQRVWDKLRVGGTTYSNGRYYVLINGKTCQEGDVLALELDGKIYRFQVKTVNMNGVEIKKLDVKTKPAQPGDARQ